jgi:hypothetical protein
MITGAPDRAKVTAPMTKSSGNSTTRHTTADATSKQRFASRSTVFRRDRFVARTLAIFNS